MRLREVMLDKYRWEKRILIIFSYDAEFVYEQKRLLTQDRYGLVDRDMILFGFSEDTVPFSLDPSIELDKLRKSLSIENDTIVLIGKDGDIKAKWGTPVEAQTIFDIIDAMPMRQREMKKRGR